MLNWIKNLGKVDYESKEYTKNGLKKISIDEVIRNINYHGTTNHKMEFNSFFNVGSPESNNPWDISTFLNKVFGDNENYKSCANIKHIVSYGRRNSENHRYLIETVCPHTPVDKFSATISFKYK